MGGTRGTPIGTVAFPDAERNVQLNSKIPQTYSKKTANMARIVILPGFLHF
jgi:hypothetical protein